ncbi:MAG TPA: spore coat protein, partial [Spirochaetia bacterium]|nr:spore coat protein [Spirochaetia bacterium]
MTDAITIGRHRIGTDAPCFIIAEAGTAHGGDIDKAFALIDAAERAGADCVKFQVVYADEIVHPRTGEVELPGGRISLYEKFKSLEKEPAFFKRVKAHAEERGLIFLATPFGEKSALLLREIGVQSVKIASPELNHFPLLALVESFHVPLILSTGVSTVSDIEAALRRLSDHVLILHCITSYPAPPEEYNLRLLPLLSRLFNRLVGVSDHSRDPLLVPLGALLMG